MLPPRGDHTAVSPARHLHDLQQGRALGTAVTSPEPDSARPARPRRIGSLHVEPEKQLFFPLFSKKQKARRPLPDLELLRLTHSKALLALLAVPARTWSGLCRLCCWYPRCHTPGAGALPRVL